MHSLKDFGRFLNESSEQELEALRYLIQVGLLTSPLEEFRAALSDEGDSELLQYAPEVGQGSGTVVYLRFSFDMSYNFPDLEDDLKLGLELDDELQLAPEIDLEVELDWQTGALTWRVGVQDDELDFREVKELQSEPDEQYSVLDPDSVEQVLTAVESFIGDGPVVNGRHQTELYSCIIDIYAEKTRGLRRGEDSDEEE